MATLNVKAPYLKMLTDIFENYCPEAEIWAYGSRINGKSHDGSDLDLVVRSFNSDEKYITELKDLINESNIPFLVDIHDFNSLPKSFQEEIEKEYVVLFKQI